MKPVAICVPTYNRAGSLAATLKSILGQTWRDLRVIVVDNASVDATESVVRSFTDDRLQYVRNPSNLGMTGNWNRCRELALKTDAAYIGIYHSDDVYEPTIVERLAGFMEARPNVGFAHSAVRHQRAGSQRLALRGAYPGDRVITARQALDDLCLRSNYWIAAATVLARREAFEKAGGFDPAFKICPDLDLWWRMLEHFDMGYVAEPLAVQTMHEGQVSGSDDARRNSLAQAELEEVIVRAVRRMAARRPDLDAARYEQLARRYCTRQTLRAAFSAARAGRWADAGAAGRRLAVRATKRLGVYEIVRSAKDGAYRGMRDSSVGVELGLRHLLGGRFGGVSAYAREFENDGFVRMIDEQLVSDAAARGYVAGSSSPLNLKALYILCRVLRPETVVETGVASGASSLVILSAMRRNQRGRLYSIDLPPEGWAPINPEYRQVDQVSTAGRKPGWLVPDDLRGAWTLTFGDAKVETAKLMKKLPAVDLFYHDAEHSREAMLAEFRAAWPKIRRGGCLTSDDVGWNTAFKEFSAEIGSSGAARSFFSFGLIKKVE